MNLEVVNIIARTNGVGLDRDVSLVKNVLQKAGFKVVVSEAKRRSRWLSFGRNKEERFKVNIFMERVFPRWIASAEVNILMPNQERFPRRHVRLLKGIDTVFAKSKHAQEVFSKYHKRVVYTGFISEDLLEESIAKNAGSFLHLAGKSTLKGTEAVLNVWGRHPEWPRLTLVQCKENGAKYLPSNVDRFSDYLSKEEVRRLMNEHAVHLCPSRSEGWGHYIVEALSCGACVLTTDAAPMNEIVTKDRGILISYDHAKRRHLGVNYWIKESELEEVIQALVDNLGEEISTKTANGRAWFERNTERFQEKIVSELRNICASNGA